ncbi:MAG: STAS domain-containing protein [Clostridiales bacterium]|jgi:stage II sporulation protein AA (anti-sigma F factor antagonist)|nr:STAS domain-containing protein [Clostridiales bacterium]
MKIESKLLNQTLYVSMEGELDEHASHYARTALDALLASAGAVRVVIDMSGLSFMDSTGIGVLLGRYKKLKVKGVPIYIANPGKTIDKILKMTGLYDIMPKIG